MFYLQLLQMQISKVQKDWNLTVFFALSGSERVKAACKMLIKLTTGGKLAKYSSMTKMFGETLCLSRNPI